MKICLDPGHGGRDPGAVGPTGLSESDVVLHVALALGHLLAPKLDVIYTRTIDTALGPDVNADLAERCRIANSARADWFVSIHCNSADSGQAKGTETYCLSPGGQGEQLANAIHKKMVNLGLVDRGVKNARFYVLRDTNMPAVLVETAFISHPGEEEKLADPIFQYHIAQAIANGIADFLGICLDCVPKQPSNEIHIQIGGETIAGRLLDGVTYGPARALAKALKLDIAWDGENFVAVVEGGQYVMGAEGKVDRPAVTVKDKVIQGITIDQLTYVPIRSFADALGKKVDWDTSTHTATIS